MTKPAGRRVATGLCVAIAMSLPACGSDEAAPSAASDPADALVSGSVPPDSESPSPAQVVSEEERSKADIVLFTGSAPQGIDNGGYGFEEDSVSSPGPTITVAAGELLTLVLQNVSEEFIPHDLAVVAERDEHENEPLASTELLWGAQTATIDPGESTLIEFTPLEPGRYFYLCTLFGHMNAHGMWGRLIVEES